VSPDWQESSQSPAPLQISPSAHAVPHTPQFALSVSVSTHVPLQSVRPVWQLNSHTPAPLQISPSAHEKAQMPLLLQ
jgi:hypothetical protein